VDLAVKDYSNLPLVLTLAEVKEILGIGMVQTYNLVHREDFPKKQIGRRIIVPTQAFIKWLNDSGNEKGEI